MRRLLSSTLPLVLATCLSACAQAHAPIRPVDSVDLPRFMGRWYVIASIPSLLERGGHNAVETYRLDDKGNVCTWFRLRPDGFEAPVKLIHSEASVVPGSHNAEWKVRFFGLFKAQYLIGWLAPDYSQVLIVRDARDYLWYMARTPGVTETDYQAMLKRAQAMGYDITRIQRVPQQWPEHNPDSGTFADGCN